MGRWGEDMCETGGGGGDEDGEESIAAVGVVF